MQNMDRVEIIRLWFRNPFLTWREGTFLKLLSPTNLLNKRYHKNLNLSWKFYLKLAVCISHMYWWSIILSYSWALQISGISQTTYNFKKKKKTKTYHNDGNCIKYTTEVMSV